MRTVAANGLFKFWNLKDNYNIIGRFSRLLSKLVQHFSNCEYYEYWQYKNAKSNPFLKVRFKDNFKEIPLENCKSLGFPRKISAFRPFFDKSSLATHQDVIDGNEKLDEFPFCSSDESDDSELSFCKRSWIIPLILIFEYVVALLFNFFRKLLHCLPFVWIFDSWLSKGRLTTYRIWSQF